MGVMVVNLNNIFLYLYICEHFELFKIGYLLFLKILRS